MPPAVLSARMAELSCCEVGQTKSGKKYVGTCLKRLLSTGAWFL